MPEVLHDSVEHGNYTRTRRRTQGHPAAKERSNKLTTEKETQHTQTSCSKTLARARNMFISTNKCPLPAEYWVTLGEKKPLTFPLCQGHAIDFITTHLYSQTPWTLSNEPPKKEKP
jgi:hypothetical protein